MRVVRITYELLPAVYAAPAASGEKTVAVLALVLICPEAASPLLSKLINCYSCVYGDDGLYLLHIFPLSLVPSP